MTRKAKIPLHTYSQSEPTAWAKSSFSTGDLILNITKSAAIGVMVLGVLYSSISLIQSGQDAKQRRDHTASRLAKDGLSEMSSHTASELLDVSIPITDENGNLLLVGWEQVIKSKKIPPGVYLTPSMIVEKVPMGAAPVGEVESTKYGHRIGFISPDSASERAREYTRRFGVTLDWKSKLENL